MTRGKEGGREGGQSFGVGVSVKSTATSGLDKQEKGGEGKRIHIAGLVKQKKGGREEREEGGREGGREGVCVMGCVYV